MLPSRGENGRSCHFVLFLLSTTFPNKREHSLKQAHRYLPLCRYFCLPGESQLTEIDCAINARPEVSKGNGSGCSEPQISEAECPSGGVIDRVHVRVRASV